MSILDRLQAVRLAEIECGRHAGNARASWKSLKYGARQMATPWRIVAVGAIAGFLTARSGGGASTGGGVGGRLLSTIAQALITTLGASATAGMAAGAAADAAAVATTDAVQGNETTPEARIQAASQTAGMVAPTTVGQSRAGHIN